MGENLSSLRLSPEKRKELVKKALAAADEAEARGEIEPPDTLALLEESVRMLEVTLALPGFKDV